MVGTGHGNLHFHIMTKKSSNVANIVLFCFVGMWPLLF